MLIFFFPQGLYARTFNCNLDEALDGNLENYSCLAEFFRRKLKDGVRPIDPASSVVAPSDGTVLNFGRVTAGESSISLNIFRFFGIGISSPICRRWASSSVRRTGGMDLKFDPPVRPRWNTKSHYSLTKKTTCSTASSTWLQVD